MGLSHKKAAVLSQAPDLSQVAMMQRLSGLLTWLEAGGEPIRQEPEQGPGR